MNPPPPVRRGEQSPVLLGGVVAGLLAGALLALPSTQRLAIVAAAAGIVFLVATSIEQKILLYFVTLPLVRWAEIHLPGIGPVANLPDVIALVLLVHLAFAFLTRRAQMPAGHPYVLLVGGYIAIVLVQSWNPVITPTGEGLPGARVYLEPLVLFFGGLATLANRDFVRRWLKVVVATALVSGVWMLRQFLFGFSASELEVQREQAIRTIAEQKLFSTLGSPAIYGFVAGFFVLLCLVARSVGVWPRLATAGASLAALGVLVSGLRISLVGTVVAVALLVVVLTRGPSRRFATRAIIVGGAGALVLGVLVWVTPAGDRDATFEAANPAEAAVLKLALLKEGSADEDVAGRLRRFGLFLDFITEHPEGAGPGLVKLVDARVVRDPDTPVPPLPQYILDEPWIFQHDFYYFTVGVELGLVPLLLFLVLLVGIVAMSLQVRRRTEDQLVRGLLLASAAVATLALVQNLTNESFRTPQVAGYVWFLAAAPVLWSGRGRHLREGITERPAHRPERALPAR
jgi:hypothetical protein